jgi:heterodisulfide reductase subunit B
MTSCAICYCNLRTATQRLEEPELKARINGVLAGRYSKSEVRHTEVKHALEVILEALEMDQEALAVPLTELKVAPYYGCLMTRPKGIDSAEFPTILEKLLRILKAEPLDFRLKTFCCGGPIFMPQEEAAEETAFKILKEAGKAGADVIVTLCPLCHLMLDAKQKILEGKRKEKIGIPVLYVTQLVGIALGLGPEELGLNLNAVSPMVMVERIYEKMAEGK